MIGRHAAHLLGRHVADRAEHHARQRVRRRQWLRGRQRRGAGDRRLRLRELGQAEVENLHPAVVGDEEVLRLEVPVDDPLLVRRRQPVRDLDGVLDRLADRQRAGGQTLAQRLAFEQLGDEVRRAVDGVPMSYSARMLG